MPLVCSALSAVSSAYIRVVADASFGAQMIRQQQLRLLHYNTKSVIKSTNRSYAKDSTCYKQNKHPVSLLGTRNILSRPACFSAARRFKPDQYRQQYRCIRLPRRALEPTELEARFKMEWPKITLFGDSITRRSVDPDNGCWGSMIQYKAGNYFDVVERGFEGYNSRWGLDLMPKLFPRSFLEKVEIFVIFLGHNDSLEYNQFPAHVPIDEYDTNMRAIVKYLLDNGLQTKNIVLITPSWYHQGEFEKFLQSISIPATGKDFDKAKKYADAVLSIANEFNIDCVDFFDISHKYEPLQDLFCDGIHFSRHGAKVLFDNIMPLLERKIESNLKKPLADLFHVTPFELRPEVKPLVDMYREQLKQAGVDISKIHIMRE